MAINISTGGFTVLNGAVADLRTNYAATRTAINTEVEATHGLALPAIAPNIGILASDRRNPPQSRAFILCEVQRARRVAGPSEARESFRLVVTAGLRHTARKAGEVGTNDQSGNELAHLLSRAADHILTKHMPKRSGVYAFEYIDNSDRPVRGPKGTWMREQAYRVWVRTRHSLGEA